MKQFIKDWVLPPKILSILLSQISLYKTRQLGVGTIKKNSKLKDNYKGERCFILGNAPTIKDIDITLLKDEYVFVMSTFYNHPDYHTLKKTFFSSVNITGSKCEQDTFLHMKAIEDNTKVTDTFFFDLRQKEIIEKNNFFHNKNVFYIASACVPRSFELSKITGAYATNIIQTLEVAMYLGFSEIYLHSVNINLICENGKYNYFFDRKLLPIKDPNVVDDATCKADFFIQVETTSLVFKELKIIYQYALKNNIKIYYTNEESLLKFFEYKSFEELFNA